MYMCSADTKYIPMLPMAEVIADVSLRERKIPLVAHTSKAAPAIISMTLAPEVQQVTIHIYNWPKSMSFFNFALYTVKHSVTAKSAKLSGCLESPIIFMHLF